ncbi:MAG: histidine--tRNA ligase [Candidatus Izemoplasmatales bacterium]
MIVKIKGTQDILPDESSRWQELETVIRNVSALYDFKEIRTPIFEASELYHRGVGEGTDIVKKETYDFADRGDRMVTLRPEGTAGVVRAVVENKLYADPSLPLKLYYVGPMFRYERPQKGRQRQFHQFGAEALGSTSPQTDAEMIAYAVTTLKALRLPNVKVKVNSLGGKESKESYRTRLLSYLEPAVGGLCPDCQQRYKENPLRVLDCKVDRENPVLKDAPKPLDDLNAADRTHFETVLSYLDAMHVAYEVDKSLVRGLDYYTRTVFELEADLPSLGAQATLGGGGRYDDLVEGLDGPAFPAVGFAFGMERLLLAREAVDQGKRDESIHVFLIALGDAARPKVMELMTGLRHGGLICDADFMDRPLKGQFKQAERLGAAYTVILGETEVANGTANVKDAKTGEQTTVNQTELYGWLVDRFRAQEHSCSGDCGDCGEDCH